MDPLTRHCPQCHAKPGEKCRNYLGKGCAPHGKRRNMTDTEKHVAQAQRKAEAMNAKAKAEAGPLFADQVEQTTPAAEYWRWRRVKALAPSGEQAAELWHVGERWDIYVLRRIARQAMRPEDFKAADGTRWTNDPKKFWRDVLLGRGRIVLSYWRHVYGCGSSKPNQYHDGPPFIVEKRVEVGEGIVWPPPGWTPPLTEAELDALLVQPAALPFPNAVDPLRMAEDADR